MSVREATAKTTKKRGSQTKVSRLKVARLSMRVDTHSKAKLERAAAYNHESVSDYVVTRALQPAESDIMTHERLTLAAPVWDIFFEALNNPPKPNARLKAMLKKHDQEVVSR